jgi:hypothetical protein
MSEIVFPVSLVSARGAIDLHQIARPKYLDPGRVQRDQFGPRVLGSFRTQHHIWGRTVNKKPTLDRTRVTGAESETKLLGNGYLGASCHAPQHLFRGRHVLRLH